MTDVEQKLWAALRNRQLSGFKFRRQATIGRYVADFLMCGKDADRRLDGGQQDATTDAMRTACLQAGGYRVERFWNHDVVQNLDGVLRSILSALKE